MLSINQNIVFTQKIYFNDKPIVITNSAAGYTKHNPISAGYLFLNGAFDRNIRIAKKHLKTFSGIGAIIEDIDTEALKQLLNHYFTPVTAAGGIVSTPDNKTLMIFRRGKWDLPKGKLDDGESIEECAIREVMEETGLPNKIVLGEKICETYHVYPFGKQEKEVLKTTHWFRMHVDKEWELSPQKEENILEATWIPKEELNKCLLNSWEAVRTLLKDTVLNNKN